MGKSAACERGGLSPPPPVEAIDRKKEWKSQREREETSHASTTLNVTKLSRLGDAPLLFNQSCCWWCCGGETSRWITEEKEVSGWGLVDCCILLHL